MLRIIILLFTLCFLQLGCKIKAQVAYREIYSTWEEFLEHYTDEQELTSEEVDNLSFLKDNPININSTNREALLQLPFLSEPQIDSLLAYRNMKGKLLTLGELQFISGWDLPARRFTSLFTYIGESPDDHELHRNKFTSGKHIIDTRLDIPTYKRKGYKIKPGGYLGDALKNISRYRYSSPYIKYGITLEKDAGEPFASQGNNPFDYYSLYFSYITRSKRHQYIIGDFTLHLGEGLTIGRQAFAGQLGLLNSLSRQAIQLKPHTGTNEHNYFTGVAYSYNSTKFRITTFASYRELDANIKNNEAVTLYTDGNHRTYQELKHKNTLINFTLGSFIELPTRHIHWGIGAYVTHYDKAILPQQRTYNKYAFRGDFAAGGTLTYSQKRNKHLRFTGEISADQRLHLAFSHHALYRVSADLQLSSQLRWFSKRYNSPFANSITYSSKVRNEQGIMLGAAWRAMKGWNLEAYIDGHRFPFSTYRSDGSSHGMKAYLQTTHTSTKGNTTSLRYTYNLWQKNYTNHKRQLIYEGKHRVRLQYAWKLSQWNLTSLTEAAMTHSQSEKSYYGFAIAARANYQPTPSFTGGVFGSLFYTENYASSVYAYEPLLPGMYSFGALYYKGFRIVLQSKYNWKSRGTIGLRYGVTHYFNKNKIGSDLQEIQSSSKGDFSIYLKLRI